MSELNIDKVYRAVIAANQALEDYKYHLVGGAAGTVSPSEFYPHLFNIPLIFSSIYSSLSFVE